MVKRTITGAFILAFVALFIFLKKFNDIVFDSFILLVMYCSLYETRKVYKLANKETDISIYLLPAIMCTIFNLESDLFKAIGFEVLMVIGFVLYLLTGEIIGYAIKRKNGEDEKDLDVLNKTLFDKTKNSLMLFSSDLLLQVSLLWQKKLRNGMFRP